LSLLQPLLLLLMPLLQLFGLLLVPLFHLLLKSVVRPLLRHALMLLVLPLLQLLPFLFLLLLQLFLLLLIFLILFLVATTGKRGTLDLRNVSRVHNAVRCRPTVSTAWLRVALVASTIRGRVVRPTSFTGWDCLASEISWPRSCSDGRLATIRRSP
jgi:hypothetical protein